jgi:hypothetical protein
MIRLIFEVNKAPINNRRSQRPLWVGVVTTAPPFRRGGGSQVATVAPAPTPRGVTHTHTQRALFVGCVTRSGSVGGAILKPPWWPSHKAISWHNGQVEGRPDKFNQTRQLHSMAGLLGRSSHMQILRTSSSGLEGITVMCSTCIAIWLNGEHLNGD